MTPTQIRMSDYPGSRPHGEFWNSTNDPLRRIESGEVEVRLDWISIDPGMRGWITNKRSYMPPVKPGGVMRAFGVGEVLESRSDKIAVGDYVTGFTGVQTHGVFKDKNVRKVDINIAPAHMYLSGLGMTGYTAYFGMTDIGRPKQGQTVVVSAASGAVGSVAAQIAKAKGARVIGIAGGSEKCSYLTDDLGLDAAIDYKQGDVATALRNSAPKGVDLYFDNVGGAVLEAVLDQMNYKGRIAVCGGISQYGDFANAAGPANYMTIVTHSLTMQGFTMRDYIDRVPEAFMVLLQGYKDGSLKFREHIIEGIENFPEAFDMIFEGRNHGKLLLKVN